MFCNLHYFSNRICPKAFVNDLAAMRKIDALQVRAARSQCPKTIVADPLAFRNIDMLQIWAATAQCPKAFVSCA